MNLCTKSPQLCGIIQQFWTFTSKLNQKSTSCPSCKGYSLPDLIQIVGMTLSGLSAYIWIMGKDIWPQIRDFYLDLLLTSSQICNFYPDFKMTSEGTFGGPMVICHRTATGVATLPTLWVWHNLCNIISKLTMYWEKGNKNKNIMIQDYKYKFIKINDVLGKREKI